MKKIILLTATFLISITSFSQAQLKTRTFVISDFTEKIMKVVLSGNAMIDASLREQVQAVWNISPYEFCTKQEFEAQKKSEDYYFLTVVDRQRYRESEPGVKMLCLYKGRAAAEEGVDGLYKVVMMPFCAVESNDFRELTMLPVILNILQMQVVDIMDKRFNPTGLVRVNALWQNGKWGKKLVLAEEDMSAEPDSIIRYGLSGVEIADRDAVDSLLTAKAVDTMVGYVVAPRNPDKGSVFYTMVIDARTWSLAYFEKHRFSRHSTPGFTINETKAIAARNRK